MVIQLCMASQTSLDTFLFELKKGVKCYQKS